MLTCPETNFKHGDMVYVTVSDDVHSTGKSTVTIVSNDNDETDTTEEITIFVYDDGTHSDQEADDGIYTGTFCIESTSESGATDDESDIIAVTTGVTLHSGLPENVWYLNDKDSLLAIPEFSTLLIPIVSLFFLIALVSKRRW